MDTISATKAFQNQLYTIINNSHLSVLLTYQIVLTALKELEQLILQMEFEEKLGQNQAVVTQELELDSDEQDLPNLNIALDADSVKDEE